MKQKFSVLIILVALSLVVASGCSTVNSGVFTTGAIQTRQRQLATSAGKVLSDEKRPFGTVRVNCFTESRTARAAERHNLWLACIPIACVGTYWDRSDWLIWQSDQAAYKPAGLDMAQALQLELADSGLFRKVLGPKDVGDVDWEIDGDIQSLELMLRPHLCGGSVLLSPFIGSLGLPLGTWCVEQKVKLGIRYGGPVEATAIWSKAFETKATGMMAAYYGGNPIQFGYPYEALLSPVVSEVIAGLPPMLAKAETSRPARIIATVEQEHVVPPVKPEKIAAVSPVAVARQTLSTSNGVHWAVVIGVSTYKDTRITPLRYAAEDAKSFYNWLVSSEGGRHAPANVKVLIDAEASTVNIRQALFTWLQQAVAEDQVTIYFAGHGSPDSPDTASNLFLLPQDTDYGNIASTAFPMWDVETAIKRYIRARRVVVIADACHSAGVGQGFDVARRAGRGLSVNQIGNGFEQLATVNEGICVISASGGAQSSQEGTQWGGGHGVFTHFLLMGLKGQADYAKDGKVSLGELSQYVSEQVRRSTRSAQTPIISGRFDPSWVLSRP
jgi:uncharacterized caspase-like protein